MKKLFLARRWLWVLLFILVLQNVIAGADPTDTQKKEIVYNMYQEYKKDFPSVKDISPQEAMKLMEAGKVLFVDTRESAEMEVSMLPGAISKAQFLRDLSRCEGYTIIGYCTISYRSGKFAMEMADKGIHVYNLKGGMLAWVLEGGKVYDAKGESKRVHVYGKKWNFLPKEYESVMFGFFEKFF